MPGVLRHEDRPAKTRRTGCEREVGDDRPCAPVPGDRVGDVGKLARPVVVVAGGMIDSQLFRSTREDRSYECVHVR